MHAFEECEVGQDVLEGEVLVERGQVNSARHVRVREDGLDLGSKNEPLAVGEVVEGAGTETIASGEEPSLTGIPNGVREMAVQAADAIPAPLFLSVADDLVVRLRAGAGPKGPLQRAQLGGGGELPP